MCFPRAYLREAERILGGSKIVTGPLRETVEKGQSIQAEKHKMYLAFNKGLVLLERIFNLGDWREIRLE